MNRCEQCAAENPAEARFCMSCGAALPRRCPVCGAAAPEHARFCISCGAALSGEAAAAPAGGALNEDPPRAGTAATGSEPLSPATAGLDERRTATVLFADLSGYTAIAETLDPEAVKRLLERILTRLGEEVERHGGHVDKFIGDNVMAIFGAPVAHGDDAQRAVLAGLGMQAAMSEINEGLSRQHEVAFTLRVGINTGEVLAGNLGEGYTVIGDSVNVAARLQAAARPATVTVGEETYRATRDAIAYQALSQPLELKGKAAPVRAWEAVEAATATSEPAVRWATAPLIGRRQELARLGELLDRVQQEAVPHLVTVLGEPGVGKSRLLAQFSREILERTPQPLVRRGRCLPYGTSIVYWPLGEVLRAESEILDTDPPPTARQKLSTRLGALMGGGEDGERVSSQIGLIGRVLGIGGEQEAAAPREEDPLRARELFFAAVRSCLEGLAREAPLVLIWEDIHWADEGMLDLIEHLARWSHAPTLQICLAREELLERRDGWGGVRRDATSMFIDPLDARESRELISALLGPEASSDGVLDTVAARAEGNPLFAEEIVRHLGEEPGASAQELPTTVQALLAARLDALASFPRRLLAHAAVVGRTFSEDELTSVARAEGGDLAGALHALREKDLLVVADVGPSGEPELAFKHALIRDVAYEMLPKATRAQKHFEVAQFIEARSSERIEEVVALLAEHYERAAQLASELSMGAAELEPYRQKALHFLEAAGDTATSLYSNADAFSSYESARQRAGEDAEALARIAEKQGDVALRLGRVDAAIGVLGGRARAPSRQRRERAGRRAAPQDRRGARAQGRAQARDRAPPARHQPDQGRRALIGARAAVRGGGVAVHADGRQHARDLRLREGSAPGREPRRGPPGEPRAWDLRARVRAHRRLGQGAREPRAGGGAGARVRRARDRDRAVWHSVSTWRASTATAMPPRQLTRRRSRSPARWATFPPRSRSTRRSATSLCTRPTGRRRRSPAASAPSCASARAWSASCACRRPCAGAFTGARAGGATPNAPTGARASWRNASAGQRCASTRCSGSEPRWATGATPPARRRPWRRRSRFAIAPGSSHSRSRRWPPARCCTRAPNAPSRRARRPRGPPSCPSGWATRRGGPRRWSRARWQEASSPRRRDSSRRARHGARSGGRLRRRAASCCSASACCPGTATALWPPWSGRPRPMKSSASPTWWRAHGGWRVSLAARSGPG